MTRILLIVFVSGLLIAIACFVGVRALGGSPRDLSFSLGDLPEVAGESLDFDPRDKATRQIALGDVTTLEIAVPATIEYTQGDKPGVTVKGPRWAIDAVRVVGGDIFLDKGALRKARNAGMSVTIQAPKVDSFRFTGAQKVTIRDFAQDRLNIEINGAAQVEAQGTAHTVDLRMNGASNADLSHVVHDEARVEINGASNAKIAPRDAVDIRINGVGNVSLGSKPARMKKEIHGVGGVSYMTDDKGNEDAAPEAPAASIETLAREPAKAA
jgi:hypothetical protein